MVSSKVVARLAGVSQATVSRVMNNPENVLENTRNKVLKAMQTLNYHPNFIARSLVTNSTRTIGLISGTLKNGFFAETTDSIVSHAIQQDYKTMVYFEDDESKIKEIFYSLLSNKVDGILFSSIKINDPLFKEIEGSGIPYMFFNRRPGKKGNYIVLDNEMAGNMAANHLIDLGHERIAYISGDLNLSTFFERKLGLERAMNTADIRVDEDLMHFIDPSPEVIGKITWRLTHLPKPPTAIICATDMIALTCLDVIISMGIKVPDDISILGIDDIKISSHNAIQLTSIGHHKFQMGELAVENLIEMIGQDYDSIIPRQIILPPQLMVRKTTTRNKMN